MSRLGSRVRTQRLRPQRRRLGVSEVRPRGRARRQLAERRAVAEAYGLRGLEEGEAWERERRGPYVYSAHNSFLFEQQEPRAKRAIDKVARSERAALLARKRARR
jgi:hypothetical protein